MNIVQEVRRSFRSVIGSPVPSQATSQGGYHPKDPRLLELLGLRKSTNAGVTVDHYDMIGLPNIFRGIEIISNKVSGIPFTVQQKIGENSWENDPSHPSWKAIAIDPHDEFKQMDFRRTMTSWAIGRGNAVAHINRPSWPRNGKIELTPLLPDRTVPVRITAEGARKHNIADELIGKLFYETTIGSDRVAYPADDCLHIRRMGGNSYWGYDVCDLLIESLGGMKAREEFGHRFYGQGANPAGFVEVPGQMSDEAYDRLRESVANKMEGMGRAHRAILLEEGATFKQLTIDPEKAQFLEGRQFDYRVVANIVGIKVHKLIDAETNAYGSLEMAESEHRDDDILPWIEQWSGEYNRKMLTKTQRENLTHRVSCEEAKIDGWVPFKDRASGVVEMVNNDLLTRDEGRHILGFGPSGDGFGSRHKTPMNIDFTDQKNLVLESGSPANSDRTVEPPEDKPHEPSETQLAELKDAWLGKIRKRLGKQCLRLAEKDAGELIAWVDSLESESAPESIQADVDQLYQQVKSELTAVVNSVLPEGVTLAAKIQETISDWPQT